MGWGSLIVHRPQTNERHLKFVGVRNNSRPRVPWQVQTMNKTTYEKGTQNTLLRMLLRLGTKQFGSPSPELESQVRAIHDLIRLEELIEQIQNAQSWDDLLQD